MPNTSLNHYEETPAGASLCRRRRTRGVRSDRRKKVDRRDEDATVVTIDQTRKAVGADLYAAWYPVGERPTVGVSASCEGVNLLGAITEYGETTGPIYSTCTSRESKRFSRRTAAVRGWVVVTSHREPSTRRQSRPGVRSLRCFERSESTPVTVRPGNVFKRCCSHYRR